jgi:hypothetical protein
MCVLKGVDEHNSSVDGGRWSRWKTLLASAPVTTDGFLRQAEREPDKEALCFFDLLEDKAHEDMAMEDICERWPSSSPSLSQVPNLAGGCFRVAPWLL